MPDDDMEDFLNELESDLPLPEAIKKMNLVLGGNESFDGPFVGPCDKF
jgi:hypothetical protein